MTQTPYRSNEVPPAFVDSPEAIVGDTLKRLNNIEYEDALRVVRALAAFVGFQVRFDGHYGALDNGEMDDE